MAKVENMAERRRALGMKKNELAELTGVTPRTLIRIEQRDGNCTLVVAKAIERALAMKERKVATGG